MNSRLFISIIVPVFNVSKYLNRCLESLIAIKYQYKEIIIVEDCSTDGSREICEQYIKKNADVRLFVHKSNKGVQKARITGITHSRGDYVMFVDSDDYVCDSIVDEMLEAVKLYDAEMVSCGYLISREGRFFEDTRNRSAIYYKEQLTSWLSDNLFYDFDIQNHAMFPYTHGKLWKKEHLLESFMKGRDLWHGEDMVTVLHYLVHYVNCLVLIEKPLYVYVKHDGQHSAKTKIELIPSYLSYWDRLDSLTIPEISSQITGLIFRDIKPSLYDMRMNKGIWNKEYIAAYKTIRDNFSANKYLFNNTNLPSMIRRHPHFLLLKYRLYWLDYLMYLTLWKMPIK